MTSDQVHVGDCMHAGIVSCAADAPLAEVARIMGDHRVHAVAVADLVHGRPYGTWRLVSHMDVVAAIAAGQDVLAREVAATEAETISARDLLERAAQLMNEHGVSHLVVVDPAGGYPVGVISTLDVAAAFGGSQRWGSARNTAS
jgi:CBS domain-containing protein